MSPARLPCVTVLLPGLFDALALWRQDFAFIPQAPHLARLLGAARLSAPPVQREAGYEAALLQAFGLDAARFSWAMARYRLDTGISEAPALLCADPVCLESGPDRIILHPETPQLSAAEVAGLLADLNRHLAADGWVLEAPAAQHWYLRPLSSVAVTAWPRTVSPLVPGHACIRDFLPDAGMHGWRRLLTELQMLLHQHPVNQARERQGQLPVNSLWLWGLNDPVYAPSRKGELPGTVALQQLAGGGFRGRILAAMAGIPWQADADITAVTGLSDGQAVPGAVLLACPELLPPLWRDAPEDWQQVLQSLDTKLFRELAQQRQAGRWQVKLHDGSGRVWDCGPVPFWRRWRRRAVFDFSRPPPPPRPDPEAWM